MEKLDLPVIKDTRFEPKHLSMDDYLRFVHLNLKYTIDRERVRKEKMSASVPVSFAITSMACTKEELL